MGSAKGRRLTGAAAAGTRRLVRGVGPAHRVWGVPRGRMRTLGAQKQCAGVMRRPRAQGHAHGSRAGLMRWAHAHEVCAEDTRTGHAQGRCAGCTRVICIAALRKHHKWRFARLIMLSTREAHAACTRRRARCKRERCAPRLRPCAAGNAAPAQAAATLQRRRANSNDGTSRVPRERPLQIDDC
jgi:hypothetical protein